jgi:PKD repeat protein
LYRKTEINNLKQINMKTTLINLKHDAGKLKWLLMIVLLAGFGFAAKAQCAAGYTYSVSSANDGTVSFTSTSSGSTLLFSSWDFGDGTSSTNGSPSHVYAVSGTYTACLTIYDTLSTCSDSICHTFSVTNTSPPPAVCSANFVAYDSLSYGYFLNTSTGTGLTSAWTFGDGTSGTSTGNTTHLYPGPGTYNVCLTVTNALGTCTDTYCDTIRINTAGMCLGSVNTYFTATDSMGYGVFNNTPTGTGPVYFWDFGDGTASSDVGNTTHYYGSPGTYSVCLTVYETGGTYDSCTYCSYVTIGGGGTSGPCDPTFTIVQDTSNLFNYFVYNNSTGTPTMTYLWDFGDGTTSTLQYPTHTYLSSGPYYLCLTVSDSTPMITCTATFCDSLAAGHASAPITVTVVNTATGIAENAVVSSLENYPNPFSGSTTISYAITKDATVEITIMDLIGNKVASIETGKKSAGSYTAEWNAENLSSGMYLLQMKTDNQISTKKIILNK